MNFLKPKKVAIKFWNFLTGKKQSNPVGKKEPEIVIPPQPQVESDGSIKRIAIIIGHGHGDSGAVGYKGVKEFDYNSKVAKYIQEKVKSKEIKLFWRGALGITGVNGAVRVWNDDLSIELHCNSADTMAFGCEVLTLSNDKVSIKMGQRFAQQFCARFNRRIRNSDGVKELGERDRGHYSLELVNDPPPSILVEPFFLNNPQEWIEHDEYGQFLVEFIEAL